MKPLVGSLIVALAASCGTAPGPDVSPPGEPVGDGPPPARTVDVVDEQFGVRLEDPYRWMEQAEHAGELKTWLVGQNAHTRARLDSLPGLPALRKRVRELELGGDKVYGLQVRSERRFYYRIAAGEGIAKVYVHDPGGAPRMLIDPTGEKGASPAVNNFKASPDGSLVAYNISTGGSEISEIRVVDTATGKHRADVVPRIWGEFDPHWLADGSGFFYTQMRDPSSAAAGADPLQGMVTKLHVLGTDSASDRAVLGPGVAGRFTIAPREFPIVHIAHGTDWALALAVGARREKRLAVARQSELALDPIPWRPVADYSDFVTGVQIRGDHVYLLAEGTELNGTIVRVDANAPDLPRATTIVPAGSRVVEGFVAASDGLYVADLVDGASQLRHVGYDGTATDVPIGPARSVAFAHAHPQRAGAWLSIRGFDQPSTYVRVSDKNRLGPIGLGNPELVDFSGAHIERVTVPSVGGVEVPMTIIRLKDAAKDGKRPTLVHGYGGYGFTISPTYRPALMAWLERGGVYALCHVRGGGAKGRSWHIAGKGKNKPKGIRDFVACAEHMARTGYTSAAHIAARGGSMGGVLVGRAITESPDAFAAAILGVPTLNPLRYLESQNGANQSAELGATPDTAEGFATLLAMDSYHNIAAGTQYPATMVVIGLNDQRVVPWMSAKFPARLQASDSTRPVLIRAASNEGHGVGSTRTQKADSLADQWAFALAQTGHPDFQR